ncbi:hypothetical protein IVB18_29935 [Bradyrhizobium sp. 186]|uniref:hypothetical protein n=1 Tax=Bradyrhizobium sp. 186 TaxID=2782654 RepID=UPI002001B488|nr:hypothetical protein [Bradyrhizobium sp. 186]UPK40730.1 hypothetical protein IVB18_29935 [Bradyrhizobium sp. 186]
MRELAGIVALFAGFWLAAAQAGFRTPESAVRNLYAYYGQGADVSGAVSELNGVSLATTITAVMPRLDRGIQYAAAPPCPLPSLEYWIARSSRAMTAEKAVYWFAQLRE